MGLDSNVAVLQENLIHELKANDWLQYKAKTNLINDVDIVNMLFNCCYWYIFTIIFSLLNTTILYEMLAVF